MKKIIPILSFLAISHITAAAETPPPVPSADNLPLIQIEANAGAGYVLAGKQVDTANSSLSPSPDYHVNFMYGGRVTVMPSRFGFQAGFRRNLFRSTSIKGGGGYSVFTYDTLDAGVNYMMPISAEPTRKGRAYLFFGAGLNYSMLQLADQYKSDLQASANKLGLTLIFQTDPATGVGGYAQGGITYFLSDNIFFSVGGRINYINTKFKGATSALDSWGIEVPFGIGVAF